MIKIPKINALYWVLMVLATTIGEIAGNLISRNLGLGYSTGSVLLISIYLITLTIVAITGKESHLVYWVLIISGNIAGTNCADFITIEPLKLGTIYGSLLVMLILIIILVIWKIVSPKSAIDGRLSKTAFFLYWFAILTSSTFGTTFGDFLSNDTSLGAGGGTLFLLIILALISVMALYVKASEEICYWAALVVIHPIGATIGNYISKPAGLNFGNIWTSTVLIIVFALLFIVNEKRTVPPQVDL